jgi:MFS family permease
MNSRRFSLGFFVGFCLVYFSCLTVKWAPFVYYPAVREIHRHLTQGLGPAMSYYGWLTVGLLGGAALGSLLVLFPDPPPRAWRNVLYITSIVSLGVTVFLNKSWFL